MKLAEINEIADVLGVQKATVTRYVQKGDIDIAKYSCAGRHLYDMDVIREKYLGDAYKDSEKNITVEEASRIIGVSHATLNLYIRKGFIVPSVMLQTNRMYVDIDDVLFMKEAVSLNGRLGVMLNKKEFAEKVGTDIETLNKLAVNGRFMPDVIFPSGEFAYRKGLAKYFKGAEYYEE